MIKLLMKSGVILFLASALLGTVITIVMIRTLHSSVKLDDKLPVANQLGSLVRTEKQVPPSSSEPCDCRSSSSNSVEQAAAAVTLSQAPTKPISARLLPPHQPNLLSYPTDPTDQPMIFIITPTYKRITQKVDLVRLCQTLMLVPNVTWIIVEDSNAMTDLVSKIVGRCPVQTVHLFVKTTSFVSRKKGGGGHRGVDQRNKGLKWIRDNAGVLKNTKGVVYFGDDDNGYDIRLFEEMRHTKVVSVWPVAFVGMLRYEGPECTNGKVVGFHASFRPDRNFPVDMAAFALNINVLLSHPDIFINPKSGAGMLETDFLTALGLTRDSLEPKADCTQIYVWHTKTEKPHMPYEKKNPGNKLIEV